MTTQDIKEKYGIPLRRIRAAIHDRRLRGEKVGGRFVIPEEGVDEALGDVRITKRIERNFFHRRYFCLQMQEETCATLATNAAADDYAALLERGAR